MHEPWWPERLLQINLFDEKDEVFRQEFKDGQRNALIVRKNYPLKPLEQH